jgi:hypothetical protein
VRRRAGRVRPCRGGRATSTPQSRHGHRYGHEKGPLGMRRSSRSGHSPCCQGPCGSYRLFPGACFNRAGSYLDRKLSQFGANGPRFLSLQAGLVTVNLPGRQIPRRIRSEVLERSPGDRSKMDRDTASYCCMSAPSGRGRRVAHAEGGATTSSDACVVLALTRHVQSLFPASAAEIVFLFSHCAERERSSKRI